MQIGAVLYKSATDFQNGKTNMRVKPIEFDLTSVLTAQQLNVLKSACENACVSSADPDLGGGTIV